MRLLVTGGAGFIGSNYARWVLDRTDDTVVVYDALTYAGSRDNLRGLEDDPRLAFVQGDVCDREEVAEAMSGCDAVVHFAAESHVDRSIVGPDAFVRTNCDGTNVVCDTARLMELEKVVHVSTDEVYGSIDEGSFVETNRLEPRSPYSASKAGADLIALAYRATFELPVAVTRSTNNFGPHQHPEKLIPLFTTNLLDGLAVPLYGDGLNVRDWCHVEDNCAAIDLVLRQGQPGEIYNIAGGNELTNRDLTDSPAGAVWPRRVVQSSRWPTGWATTGATRWTRQRSSVWGGRRPESWTRPWPPRWTGTGTTAGGGSRSRKPCHEGAGHRRGRAAWAVM